MTPLHSVVVSCVDDALLAAHLKRTTKWLQKCGCQGDGVARDQTRHVPLDVYHDPAPKELERARNVLLTVISGAENYLKDWPEHPVLNQVPFLLCTHTHTRARARTRTHTHTPGSTPAYMQYGNISH